jgi:ATP-dependent Zn protease
LTIANNPEPLQPNVGRYTTGVWTRQYLEQQLRMVLAGRAAEELVYGIDEMSSLHQHKIMQARQVCNSLGGGCAV